MNRRSFLQLFAAAAAGAIADPEKLLWTPGKKLISIPKPRTDFDFGTSPAVSLPMVYWFGPQGLYVSVGGEFRRVAPFPRDSVRVIG